MSKIKCKAVDIVFLIDARGGMQPCIDALKNNIGLFFGKFEEFGPKSEKPRHNWRARVIGYRDVEADGAGWYDGNPFVRGVPAVEAQLDSLQATGGGDGADSLLDALYKVAKFGNTGKDGQEESPEMWRDHRQARRCVIVFTDAPFHETTTLPEAPGLAWVDIAGIAMQERLHIFLFAPEMDCHDNLACIDRCEYMAIPFDPGVPGDAGMRFRAFVTGTAAPGNWLVRLARDINCTLARGCLPIGDTL